MAWLIGLVIVGIWGCNQIRNFSLEEFLGLGGDSSSRSDSWYSSPAPNSRSGSTSATQSARDTASSAAADPDQETSEADEAAPALSEEALITQNEAAVAAFAAAARLAEEVFARDGNYLGATPDTLNEVAAGRGESLPVTFTDSVSNSPSTVSIAVPAASGGSWGLAVWSPSGCLLMSKHPLQGTYRAELEPDSAEWCTGEWARQDYDSRPWWGGDRTGDPRAVWTHQPPEADPAEPYVPVDEQELAQMGDDLAEVVAAVAASLADEVSERDGNYLGATPDALNEMGADRGWLVPMYFQTDESNTPLAVSVEAPVDADGSWSLAVWSPGGCLLVAKDPVHGTFGSRLSPRAGSPCSGAWAADDYRADPGEEGDRPGIPPLEWNRANRDGTEPIDTPDEDTPADTDSSSDGDEPTGDTSSGTTAG